MNKPASELIALDKAGLDAAVRECARITAPEISDEEYERIVAEDSLRYRNTRLDMERTILAYLSAANQSGSERAGVGARGPVEVKQVHKLRHLLNHMPDKDFHLPREEAQELLRYIEALANSPAQPAPASEPCCTSNYGDFTPITVRGSSSETHGKPDGAVREALRNLLDYAEQRECSHEATHRGGSIWTICDECGKKWADDRGGFIPYQEPKEITQARAALHSPKAETSPGDAGRTAPITCPNCYDESDCSNVDICNAVEAAYSSDVKAEAKSQEPEASWLDARKLINERLDDLSAANALYGKDNRLNAPEKIERNNREITWLKDLRSVLILTHPTTKPEAPAVGVDALEVVKLFMTRMDSNGEWDDGCFYYNRYSASELQEPIRRAAALIAGER